MNQLFFVDPMPAVKRLPSLFDHQPQQPRHRAQHSYARCPDQYEPADLPKPQCRLSALSEPCERFFLSGKDLHAVHPSAADLQGLKHADGNKRGLGNRLECASVPERI